MSKESIINLFYNEHLKVKEIAKQLSILEKKNLKIIEKLLKMNLLKRKEKSKGLKITTLMCNHNMNKQQENYQNQAI